MDLLSTALKEIGLALKPLVDDATSGDVEEFSTTFRQVGIPLDEVLTKTEIQGLSEGIAAVGNLLGDDPAPLDVLTAIDNIGDTLEVLQEEVPDVDVMNLVDFFIIQQVQRRTPLLHNILVLLGVIIIRRVEPPESLVPYVLWRINWGGLSDLFQDPAVLLRGAYNWGGDDLDADKLLLNLRNVFWMLRIPAGLQEEDQDSVRGLLGDGSNDPMLRVPALYFQTDSGVWAEAGGTFLPYRRDLNKGFYGLAFAPYGVAELGKEIDLGSGWTLKVSAGTGGVLGYGVKFSPGSGLELGALDGGADGDARFNIKLGLFKGSDTGTRVVVFGEEGGSRLEVGKVGVGAGLEIAISKEGHWFIEGVLEGGQIVVANKDSDGFLAKILPPDGFTAPFDLVVGWATNQGLYFAGSAVLEITLPVHKELGPLRIDSVYLRLGINAEGKLEIALAAAVGAELGPISASVDRIGVDLKITLERSPEFTYGFVPPKGAGLAITAGPVIGGGYLEFDSDNERYAGILQLKFGGIGITAIALITTRMPDGSKNFSMLAILNVEFFPPIQLSFGFTLSAIGGLVGINRTMVLEVLRDGVRNGTLDSILFPQDPIENAPRIISDLRAVFPPEEGRFIVGPMVRIGYGSPEFITAEIAILIELPMPIRVALLGQLAAFFPLPDEAIVELHIDVLGTIETDKQLISIDATIYDSRILTFTLTGDAALRLKWGDNPVFATSLGGFHPKFSPPPNFPTLRRLRLSLGAGNNPRFNCDAYKALTSNSLQFGARVEVYASYGAQLQGNLGFDSLFYFSPFSFEAGLSGYVSAKYKGRKLASVRLNLYLSGPTPWYAEGNATIEIPVLPDVDVQFDKTWGPSAPAIIAAINPWDEFVAALNRPESWGSSLPAGRSMVESLRSLEEEVTTESTAGPSSTGTPSGTPSGGTRATEPPPPKPIVVHPAGALEVRQKVLPIDMRLYKFGNAPIAGHTKYDIEAVGFDHEDLEDYFARGQFEELSNEDKVSKPSYEPFKNGIAISSNVVAFNDSLTQEYELEYESEYINEENVTESSNSSGKLEGARVRRLLAGAASKRSPLRTTGRQKYARLGKAAKVSVGSEGYVLVNAADMTYSALPGAGESMTRMAADTVLRDSIAGNPELEGELLVVPFYEVAA